MKMVLDYYWTLFIRCFTAFLLIVVINMGEGPQYCHAQLATGSDIPVVEHELSNGMRFFVLPRIESPTVSFVVQYQIGSVNEVPGKTGLAHLLEHLLFKGTSTLGTRNAEAELAIFARMDAIQDSIQMIEDKESNVAKVRSLQERIEMLEDDARAYVLPNEFERILSNNGARGLNASTNTESTTYFVEMPSNRAELWFMMESERMKDPVFREFYTERNVVAEERRLRVDTNPGGLLYEAHMKKSFDVHPYGQPVVGLMSDIQELDRRDVQDYYYRYYSPNNTVVAIVGDVDPFQMKEWAELYFGDLEAGDLPPPVTVLEPEQTNEKRVEVVFDAEPQIRIGWHVPEEQNSDVAALSVLSSLLTGGRTSRLYQRLVVKDRIATLVTSVMGPGSKFPRLFTVEAITLSPHSTSEIEEAVYAELDSLRHNPPSESELQRIRNRLEAGQIRGLTSNLGLAFNLAGSASIHGDWRTTFRFIESLSEVQPEDVRRVVETYFTPENRTVASLLRTNEVPVR